jgi:cellobiose transport system permease protein
MAMSSITLRKTKKQNRSDSLALGRNKSVSYAKWGYIFILPFFIAYAIFSLFPLISTIYNSFFENYMMGLEQVGPNFVGFDNYATVLTGGEFARYFSNTIFIWILGFVPQILIALLLAVWFTDLRLRLRALGFFKTVVYLPNMIMAAAFSMLFYTLFSDAGPINNILNSMGLEAYRFTASAGGTRGLIALMNFLLWFGNTTILLMAGIMGIDSSLFESAAIDGAKAWQVFRKVTLPLLKPIMIYVLITCLIGGIQMFDIPQIFTKGDGNPDKAAMTVTMFLNQHLYSKNFGMAGAVSVIMFIITAVLSVLIFRSIAEKKRKARRGL